MLNIDQIATIAVCGAGTMGAGIAQVAAGAGYRTLLFDVQPAALEKARLQITQQLDNAVARGRLDAAGRAAVLENIQYISAIGSCTAPVIIEAIIEQPAAKAALFKELSAVNGPATVFATNTSSLAVTDIAAGIEQPGRVAGMHFFNPAPVMKLVEIVSARQTLPEVADVLYLLAQRMGKTPVHVKDAPGFIVNRVARHYYLEAMRAAEEGSADFRAIDRLLESAGFRMGPFALMDLIGNDVNLAVTQSLYKAFAQAPRFRPSPLQEERVRQGHLGRKSGRGFYEYSQS